MATRISYFKYSSDGRTSHEEPLLECKESPLHVLGVLKNTHLIHYCLINCPVDMRRPNDSEGLSISQVKDTHLDEVISRKGASIADFDITKIKGYYPEFTRVRNLASFRETVAKHIKDRLDIKSGVWSIEKLKPVEGKNYLLIRHSEEVAELAHDQEKVFYRKTGNPQDYFTGFQWAIHMEQYFNDILSIARVCLGDHTTEEDLINLYKEYHPQVATSR